MIRCCLCRRAAGYAHPNRGIERTKLPGSGYRCIDHAACRKRAKALVKDAEKCSAEFRDMATVHTHNCIDYADHSMGAHVCGECGILWGFKAQASEAQR